jgi:hypothetical protein
LFINRYVQLVTLATRHAVPAIYPWREIVEIGGAAVRSGFLGRMPRAA